MLSVLRTVLSAALLAALFAAGAFASPARAADGGDAVMLVAKPKFTDPFFGATVLIVKSLGERGHVGFIVNRPTTVTLAQLFPGHAPSKKVLDPVYLGGFDSVHMLFAAVRTRDSPGTGSFEMLPGLYVAMSAATVDRIIEAQSDRARFFVGAVVWKPGELDTELEKGLWYTLPADPSIVNRSPQGLWEDLVGRAERIARAL
jgi:putative transcriptional regulator